MRPVVRGGALAIATGMVLAACASLANLHDYGSNAPDATADTPSYGARKILASGQTTPVGIALDGEDVYWIAMDEDGAATGTVMSVPKSGGTPIALPAAPPPTTPSDLAVDDNNVYWAEDNCEGEAAVVALSKKGGTENRMPSCDPYRLTLDGDSIFAAFDYALSAVYDFSPGGADPVFKDYGGHLSAIAVDSTYVYVGDSLSNSLLWVPKAGAPTPQVLLQNQGTIAGMQIAGEVLYWVTSAGTVMAMPLPMDPDAGAPAAITLASGQDTPSAIAVFGSSVYWTNSGSGTVMMVPQSGGTPTTLATGQYEPNALAVDATGVYWTTQDGNVMVRPNAQ